VVAGTYYDANWNEINADGSPKTAASTGVTYRQVVDTDGSLSGVPGATVQVSSSGAVSIVSRPASGGGGGGGAASQAGRYSTQVDATGAITGIPGAVYQQDSVDGSITIVSRPSATTGSFANPLDKNNDGLNDSTGWANGVFKDSSSPSGFYYASNGQYIPVTPDGAPYNGPDLSGGGGGGALKTWNGTGPDGRYGTWVLGPDGMPKTYLGDPRSPSTSSGGGGGGGGGGSLNSTVHSGGFNNTTTTTNTSIKDITPAAAAAELALAAAQGQNQANHDAMTKAIADADRAQRALESRAQFELQRYGLVSQQTKDQLAAARQVADLISSTDPIAYRVFLAAGGGEIWNGLVGGGTAVSDNANLGAARSLRAMDNPAHIPTWDEIMSGGGFNPLSPPTMGANGVPVGGSGAGGVGNTPTTGVPIGYGNDAQGTNTSGGAPAPAPAPLTPEQQAFLQRLDNITASAGSHFSGKQVGGASGAMESRMPGAPGNFDLGPLAGVPLTVQQRNDFANAAYQNWTTDAYNAPGHALNFNNYTPYVTQGQYTGIVGSAPAVAPAETFTDRFGNLQPAPAAMPYGNDQVNNVIPTPNTAVAPNVSRFARGGVMVGGGMAVTGDSHNGKPNEEMVINLNPDPRDRIAVVPLNRVRQMGMGPAIQSVMGRGGMQVGGAMQMPRAADGGIFGTDTYLNPITPEDQPYLDRIHSSRLGSRQCALVAAM
jgi:hypothetical protein